MPCLDVRARGEIRLEGLGGLLRDREPGWIARREDRRPPERVGDDRLRFLTGRKIRDLDEHLLHAAGQRPIANLADIGRDILTDDLHCLLRPFRRHRKRGVDPPAGPPRGDDRQTDAIGLATDVPQRRPAGRERLIGELSPGGGGRQASPQTDRQAGGANQTAPRHRQGRSGGQGGGGVAVRAHERGIGSEGGPTVVRTATYR